MINPFVCTKNGVDVPCREVVPGLALQIGLPVLLGIFVAKRTKDVGYGAMVGIATAVAMGVNIHRTPDPTVTVAAK